MSKRNKMTAAFSAAGLFLMILDGKTAILAASEGIELCIRSVIPALFPFFVLSNLLTGSLIGQQIPFMKPVCRYLRIPEGAESLALTGFLGGYPVGAQCITTCWKAGQLSRRDAEQMLAFCNNAGPSFLFGIIGPILSVRNAWILWCVHLCSALLVSLCIPSSPGTVTPKPRKAVRLPETLHHALETMASVCGWILLFRICIAFLKRWVLWLLPPPWSVAITGFMELTNGCLALDTLADQEIQFILCAAMLGFGGICVTMQTVSVTQGLRLRFYFPGKMVQTACSICLSCLLFPGHPAILWSGVSLLGISTLWLRKIEKRSGNQMTVGV